MDSDLAFANYHKEDSKCFLLIKRPFKVGEIVEVSKIKGTVKEMSIASCIVITDDNEYVTIPNSKIWGGPIKNLSRLKKT